MLEALNADYVRTAKAKGLAPRAVVGRHAFRNALLPVTTNIALELPFLVSGAIVTETIFSWPGTGRLFIESVGERDYYVLMALHHPDVSRHPHRQPGRGRRLRDHRPTDQVLAVVHERGDDRHVGPPGAITEDDRLREFGEVRLYGADELFAIEK